MERTVCNLCGRTKELEVYGRDKLHIVMCMSCSLVYASPRPTSEEFREMYSDEYQSDRHSIASYDVAVARLENKGSYKIKEEYVRKYLLPYLGSNKKVFEVGTGWGTMLRVIADTTKARVAGVENSALAAQVAKDFYGLDVTHSTFEEYSQKSKEKFDVVVMFHVLEHFLDVGETLKSVRELLTDKGVLIIAVPNLSRPNEAPERFFQKYHTYYFSPATLEALASRAGFQVLKHWFTGYDMGYVFFPGHAKTRRDWKYRPIPIYLRLKLYIFAAWCYSSFSRFIPKSIAVYLKSVYKKMLT